jgi:hypothetical protein
MSRYILTVLLVLVCATSNAQIQAVWGDITQLTAQIAQNAVAIQTLNDYLWEDLRFPATAINLSGAPAAPGVDNTTFYGSLEFAGNAINDCAFQVQMPHGWANGTAIYPHLHLVNGSTSTATSTWEIWYRKAEVGGDFGSTWTGATATFQLTGSTTVHTLKAFPAITMTGLTDSCMLSIFIRRHGNADPHNDIIRLLEFDIHYQSSTRGSVNETGDH